MLFDMIKEEPKIDFMEIIGYALIIGTYGLFLIPLHIIHISSFGGISVVLVGIFNLALMLFYAILIFSGVLVVYKILRLLVWQVMTPVWQKNQIRQTAQLAKQKKGGFN